MDKIVLDTDMLSEVLKGRNARVAARARAYVAEAGRLTTSVLTITEIVKGFQRAAR